MSKNQKSYTPEFNQQIVDLLLPSNRRKEYRNIQSGSKTCTDITSIHALKEEWTYLASVIALCSVREILMIMPVLNLGITEKEFPVPLTI